MASRFEVVSHNVKQIGDSKIVVVQDQKTGVLYAYAEYSSTVGGGVSFTPIIDADGKPVVEAPNHDEY